MGRVRTGRRTNPDLRLNVSSDGSSCTWDVRRGMLDVIISQIRSDQLGTKGGSQVGLRLKQIRTLSVHLD